MKGKTKFNWQCIHCNNRNLTVIAFQFDVPKYYEADWDCGKCGKFTKIKINLEIGFAK